MDFVDKIRTLAATVPKQMEHVQTEEATKHALVMPFIQALGYNVFDPIEVTPELIADVGTKKGEKVDYAIHFDGKPTILFECKWRGADLDKEHASQLYRYFSVSAARFGVLTNGVVYRFFTDLEEPNKMDSKPFFEFNMLNFTDAQVEELKRFSKSGFVLDQATSAAVDLKYTREIKRIMGEQLVSPTEEIVSFFARQIYPGKKLTQSVRTQFTEITKRALQQFISERIADRLKTALAQEAEVSRPQTADSTPEGPTEAGVVTTEDEREAFYIVKGIIRQVLDPKRVSMRDAQSYCVVLVDDNNRKTLCRFYFGTRRKAVGIFGSSKQEQRVDIAELNDIYLHAEKLLGAAASFASLGTDSVAGA